MASYKFECTNCRTITAIDTNVSMDKIAMKLKGARCLICNNGRIVWDASGAIGQPLYLMFEKEFGRALSPFEIEQLATWENDYSPQIIKMALKEAVISRKLNFRYIDKILFTWEKQGIKTAEEAQEFSKQFRVKQHDPLKQTERTRETSSVLFYNWLGD